MPAAAVSNLLLQLDWDADIFEYIFTDLAASKCRSTQNTKKETQVKRVYQRIFLSEMMASAEDVEVFWVHISYISWEWDFPAALLAALHQAAGMAPIWRRLPGEVSLTQLGRIAPPGMVERCGAPVG